jgi:predicted nucleic acid-binding Zn ribbon protein
MIQCEKDGYGVWYGSWKATQPIKKPDPVGIPEDWKVCPRCGKAFKPRVPQQKYCEAVCGYDAQKERYREKATAYHREWKARRKAGANG